LPLFTTSVQNQETASTAGRYSYPQIAQPKKFSVISDEFVRNSLNPTGAITLYTTAGTGTPAVTIANPGITIATSGTIGDNNSTRSSGLSFVRQAIDPVNLDTRSQLEMDIIWNFYTNHLTNMKMFIGLMYKGAALTALPTSADSVVGGVLLDTTANANIKLVSSNYVAFSSTDTGIAASAVDYRLNIKWTGNDSAVLSLYSGNFTLGWTTLVASKTITAIDSAATSYEIHFYVEAVAGAARQIGCSGWKAIIN